ncbi:phage major capsid protein [Patescibacteria group bacterium]|nr:phage major capsid protein [Patescibacteria group bacterium]
MATGNSSFSKLVSSTLQQHSNEVFDAISTNNALFYMLNKRGNIKVKSGGREFTHPIRYKANPSFKAYAHLEPIVTDLQDNVTRAVYPIKIVAGSLVLSKFEIAQNAGNKEKLLDLVKEVKDDAKTSMSQLMGTQSWKDGTGVKDFDGLPFLINASPSTQTAVGGIDPSATDNTYWRNQTETTGTAAFNTNQAGLSIMNTLLLNCTFGNTGPKAVITTKAVYALYELGLTSNLRYTSNELADSSFVHLVYATMPVLFDDNSTTAYIYMIDLDGLWLQVLSQGNNQTTTFEPSHNQLSDIALMYTFGNLTCGSRRTQGVATGITG